MCFVFKAVKLLHQAINYVDNPRHNIFLNFFVVYHIG